MLLTRTAIIHLNVFDVARKDSDSPSTVYNVAHTDSESHRFCCFCCFLCSVATSSKRPHITAAWVARAAVGLESGMTDEKLAELLPFTIKLVLKQNPLAHVGSAQLMPDRWRAASSVLCPKVM